MPDFSPLRCIACGTEDFDPGAGAENREEPVMSLARFWVMWPDGEGAGPAYGVCNACWDRKLGFLWNDDGTLARVWFEGDEDV
jgi:hypothetical protein